MSIEAVQVPDVAASATLNGAVDVTDQMDSGELATGTPTVTELTTSDLTISNVAVSTVALVIDGATVAIGKAITFSMTGQSAGQIYTLKVAWATDSTPAQSLATKVRFRAVDDSV